MSAVNHEQGSNPVQGGLVAEAAMATQQADAVSAPNVAIAAHKPPAATTQAAAAPAPVIEKSVMHAMTATLMVTLDLSQAHLKGQLKKKLSSVENGSGTYNLYSPFRKAGKAKGNETAAAEGVVRGALMSILDITDQINDSKLLYVGKEAELFSTLGRSVKSMRSQMEQLFPIAPGTFLTSLDPIVSEEEEDEDEESETVDIDFQKIVRLSSWLTSPRTTGEAHEIDTIAEHNAVLNMTVNAGALYDATEPVKYINQVEVILRLMQSKRESNSTAILLAVMIDPASLATQEMRDTLDTLLGVNDYALYTRTEMHGCNLTAWLPMSKAEVDRELLSPTGDLLLVQLLDDNAGDEEGDVTDAPVDDVATA